MTERDIHLRDNKCIYFASDFHLGIPNFEESRKREMRIIAWLDSIKENAQEIYLLGDVFDFWYEYNHVAPKGFIRFLGKIAELSDSGIRITFFHGNHDMWMKDYLSRELGIEILPDPIQLRIGNKKLLVGHGDGLGPGDIKYKILRKIFRSKWAQWLFTRVHPNFSFWVANIWSAHSKKLDKCDGQSLGEKEFLYQFCLSSEKKEHHDYYVFGHRHIPMEMQINENAKYINIGEWINANTFGRFNGETFELKKFEG